MYNDNLILENNEGLENAIKSIPIDDLKNIILGLISENVSINGLKLEFIENFKGLNYIQKITGENIKCYFAITLNGVSQIWESLVNQYTCLFEHDSPLYENVLEYIDEVIDKIDFDDLYKNELEELNSKCA